MNEIKSKILNYLKAYNPEYNMDTPALKGKRKENLQKMIDRADAGGHLMILPFDQGLEHGPSDFFTNPDAADAFYQLRIAKEANYSAVAFQIGLAEKFWQHPEYRDIPLILKLNGKSQIPDEDEPFSTLTSDVSDAVKLGASAVGYTMYIGSPRQDEDVKQFVKVRQEAHEAGLPVIIWAYPRGKFAQGMYGGKNSFAIVAYGARIATELGADLVKINVPQPPDTKKYKDKKFEVYNNILDIETKDMLKWCVYCATRETGVLLSGGGKISDEDVLKHVEWARYAGVKGIIFGRNIWQRKFDDAIRMSNQIRSILKG